MVDISTLIETNRLILEINTTVDTALLQDQHEAIINFDANKLARLCTHLSDSVISFWRQTKMNLVERKLDHKIDEMELVLTKIFDTVPREIDYVTNAGAFLKNKGVDISGLASLDQAKAKVFDAKSEFEGHWPIIDKTMIHESKEANKKRR